MGLAPAARIMRARQRTLLWLGALALLVIVAFNQLAGMSLRFFGASTTAARAFAHYLAGDALGAREIWRACLTRRPENARVDAYLAMLGRTGG